MPYLPEPSSHVVARLELFDTSTFGIAGPKQTLSLRTLVLPLRQTLANIASMLQVLTVTSPIPSEPRRSLPYEAHKHFRDHGLFNSPLLSPTASPPLSLQ